MNKIKKFFDMLALSFDITFQRIKYRIKNHGRRTEITKSGNDLLHYCVKVIESGGNCTPDGYAEYIADQTLKHMSEKEGTSLVETAFGIIYVCSIVSD